jgi:hypothetical protein
MVTAGQLWTGQCFRIFQLLGRLGKLLRCQKEWGSLAFQFVTAVLALRQQLSFNAASIHHCVGGCRNTSHAFQTQASATACPACMLTIFCSLHQRHVYRDEDTTGALAWLERKIQDVTLLPASHGEVSCKQHYSTAVPCCCCCCCCCCCSGGW